MQPKFLITLLLSIAIVSFNIGCSDNSSNSNPVKTTGDLEVAAPDSSYFLFVSDIHLNSAGTEASVYGRDTRLDLWGMMKSKLNSITKGANPPKFIVYTGDLPDHQPDKGAIHDTNIRTVLNELLDIAGNIPVFYAPGNNDPRGGDYSPYSDANCETPLDLARHNSGYPAPNSTTIYNYDAAYGYYSASAFDGLRVIGLNSVMFSARHQSEYDPHCSFDTLNQEQESLKQLKWLRSELEAAKTANQKAYLIMHIPPGVDAYKGTGMWKQQAWVDSLLTFTDEYSSSISGVFFGHTHMDEIRRLTRPSDPSTFSAIAISAPGVSPIFKNNPGFRKVYINADYEPIDYTTHYTSKINSVWGVNNTAWGDSSYTFSHQYGSGTTIKETLSEMSTDDLYQKMIQSYMVLSAYKTGSSFVKQGITVD
jgi:sphingomyelin phosphodiesterase acid-like 3